MNLHSSPPPAQPAVDLYDRYTSTSSLVGVDVERTIAWNLGFFVEHFRPYLPRQHDAAILDLGCGYGKKLMVLQQLGYSNCCGVDLSREQVAYAQQRLGLARVECAEALQWLDGREDTFDAILVVDVLEHLPLADLMDLGSKVRAALKPGGTLLVQTPNGMSPLNPFAYGDLTHVRAFTAQSLRQFFLHSGLEPVAYREALEHSHDVRSFVKRAMWKCVLRPSVHLFVRLAHGNVFGGPIHTANIIAIARKPSSA